jgi:hypothetical protein
MKPSNIRDDHHFVKFCKQRELIREGENVIGVYPQAFALRAPTSQFPDPEKTLSGVYYEFFEGQEPEKITACLPFINMNIKPKDALARMGVGLIKEQGKKRSRSLRVRHEPEDVCLAYAALQGLPKYNETDDELCALLAAVSIVQIVPIASLL